MDPEIQTKEPTETIEDSQPHLKSCGNCAHVKTCGAFKAFSEVLTEMEQKYDFVKKPFPPESLAVTCTEFVNVIDLAKQSQEAAN